VKGVKDVKTNTGAVRAGVNRGVFVFCFTSFTLFTFLSPEPLAQQQPVFRAGSVLVTVDTYPQRDGRIVEGLTAADFEILEDNKPQKIEEVEFVRIEPALTVESRRDPNNTREMLALVADPHNRVFVVYLDTAHTTTEGSHRIRQPLIDTLNGVMGANDLFGVLTSNMDPKLLLFGRRLEGISEQLARYWPWGERNRISTDPENPMEDRLISCFEKYPDPKTGVWLEWYVKDDGLTRRLYNVLIDREREYRVLSSLEDTVRRLAGMREARTSVFIVTDGWMLYRPSEGLAQEAGRLPGVAPGAYVGPGGRLGVPTAGSTNPAGMSGVDTMACNTELMRLARMDSPQRFRALMTEANQHNITFYPVAPLGLGMFDVSPVANRPEPGPPGTKTTKEMPVELNMQRRTFRIEGLRTLASGTDGIAVVNTNDLKAGMSKVIDDVSAYYLIRYYSTNTKNDGTFRRISVKTKAANVQLKARRGYFVPKESPAGAPGAAPGVGPIAGAAANASAAAFAAASASAMEGVPEALDPLSRLSPTTELFTRVIRQGDEFWVTVELPSSAAGRVAWAKGGEVQVSLTDAGGGTVQGAGTLAAGTRGVLVRVAATDLKGDPARVITRLTAGPELLEDRAGYRAAPTGVLGLPLLFRGTPAATSPLRPVADLQYRRTERAHLEWFLPGQIDDRSARLLGKNGLPLAVPVTVSERAVDGRARLVADVNLAPLAAGDYLIEVTGVYQGKPFRTLTAIRVNP
jgi:VWFA-related protein